MTKPLKICYIGHGGNIAVRRWMAFFQAQGHQILCLTDYEAAPLDGIRFSLLPNREKLLQEGKKARKTDVIRARSEIIQQHLESFQPDILHAHFLYMRGWSAALTGFHPLVITLLGSDIHLPSNIYRNKLHQVRDRLLNRFAMAQADLITGVSTDLCRIAQRETGNQVPVECITIGVDPDRFKPMPPDDLHIQRLRNQLQLVGNCFIILSPRQVTPLYNIDILIQALPSILTSVPNAILLIINPFAQEPSRQAYVSELKALAETLEVTQYIRWIEETSYDDMPVLYNLADVTVSIPSTDGMPASMLESLACQTPVIVGDLEAYDDVIRHQHSGIRIPLQKPEALSQAVIRIAHDTQLTKALAQNGYQAFLEFGHFQNNLLRMEAWYHRLLSRQANQKPSLSQQLSQKLARIGMERLLTLT